MTEKEAAALDKRIERLQDKIIKVKHEYEDMLEQLNDLMIKRNPEKQEEQVKERLYQTYTHSSKSLDFIIDFIENAPDDDDYWN